MINNTVPDNKKNLLNYLNFLNLSQAIRNIHTFPSIDPVEEHLLNMLADIWNQDRKITVVEAMSLSAKCSSTTTHRRLQSLRTKGMIALETDDADRRVKYIHATDLTEKYFNALGSALMVAQQGIPYRY